MMMNLTKEAYFTFQVRFRFSHLRESVLGEESAGQILDRASRLGYGQVPSLRIMTETRVEVPRLLCQSFKWI